MRVMQVLAHQVSLCSLSFTFPLSLQVSLFSSGIIGRFHLSNERSIHVDPEHRHAKGDALFFGCFPY